MFAIVATAPPVPAVPPAVEVDATVAPPGLAKHIVNAAANVVFGSAHTYEIVPAVPRPADVLPPRPPLPA